MAYQKYIEKYDFYSFLLAFQEAAREGFSVTDKNEFFPIHTFGLYYATLVKPTEEEVQVEQKKIEREVAAETERQALIDKVGGDQVGAAVAPGMKAKAGRPAKAR